MMPDISNWRTSANYYFVEEADSPQIAWEWLRRNEKYQNDYCDADDSDGKTGPAAARRIDEWGLSFRYPARSLGHGNASVLAARPRYRCGHARRHTCRFLRRG